MSQVMGVHVIIINPFLQNQQTVSAQLDVQGNVFLLRRQLVTFLPPWCPVALLFIVDLFAKLYLVIQVTLNLTSSQITTNVARGETDFVFLTGLFGQDFRALLSSQQDHARQRGDVELLGGVLIRISF